MKVTIEIPKEFEADFNNDKFKECFKRILADLTYFKEVVLSGLYERETLEMLERAFQEADVEN